MKIAFPTAQIAARAKRTVNPIFMLALYFRTETPGKQIPVLRDSAYRAAGAVADSMRMLSSMLLFSSA
jgi:hypothetical protein